MHPGLGILDSPLVTFRDSDEPDEILKDRRTKVVVRDSQNGNPSKNKSRKRGKNIKLENVAIRTTLMPWVWA